MSCKGNCYDNVSTETFFKTIKAELIWRTKFDARMPLAEWQQSGEHVKAGKTPLCQSIIF
jgi:putative transposase